MILDGGGSTDWIKLSVHIPSYEMVVTTEQLSSGITCVMSDQRTLTLPSSRSSENRLRADR
jgi:hypothetical protein